MLDKYAFKKLSKKDLIFLILRIHVLLVAFIMVVWTCHKRKKQLQVSSVKASSPYILERKARILPLKEVDSNSP